MSSHARPLLPTPAELAALPPDGGPNWNRLVFERSPYLLQHAANPVDWRPWGEDAFAAAAREDKPIFLSIGYSTCHWCHVMEHESFEDEEVAAAMNELFIPVKVDREERPDIDHIYMSVCQALTGHGGWPLTVVLTPERKPFYAGTYFPKHGRYNRPGMMQLLPALSRAWREDRLEVTRSAAQIADGIQAMGNGAPGNPLDANTLRAATMQLERSFDARRGGFGSRPKFPTPHQLSFLLRRYRRTGDAHALEMVTKTLTEMRRGGLFDQVGFGFHRYSTDPEWLLPHFEKMLYDQAMLLIAYTEAWQATGDEGFAQTAREIVAYAERDLLAPEGAFHSAEDADSEGEEGKFYVWTLDELRDTLADDDAKVVAGAWNIIAAGNFAEEATGQATGANIPHWRGSLDETAKRLGLEPEALAVRLEEARQRLLAVRSRRVRPQLDDKILPDWNGLFIAALARAGAALGEPGFVALAEGAARFVLTAMRDPETGRLLKSYRAGKAGLPGLIDDYAFMAWGLLELHQATQQPGHLAAATDLMRIAEEDFADRERGGFYMAGEGATDLIVRAKEIYDGAIPSGNSVAAHTLLRLALLTGNTAHEERAGGILDAFSAQVEGGARSHCHLLQALDLRIGPSVEVVLVGDLADPLVGEFRHRFFARFAPSAVLVVLPTASCGQRSETIRVMPWLESYEARGGEPTLYLCSGRACQQPVVGRDAILAALDAALPK